MITIKTGTNFMVLIVFKSNTHTPSTGLTPDITVFDTSDNSKVVDAQDMTEVGLGIYKYTITGSDIGSGKSYGVYVDGGDTLTTYRYQYGAFAGNMGNEDTIPTIDTKVDTIDTNVDNVLVDTGTTLPATLATIEGSLGNLDAPVSRAGLGAGNTPHTIKMVDDGTAGRVGLLVWLTTDAAGTQMFTRKEQTNSGGYVTFYVNAGTTYYVWDSNHDSYLESFTRNV